MQCFSGTAKFASVATQLLPSCAAQVPNLNKLPDALHADEQQLIFRSSLAFGRDEALLSNLPVHGLGPDATTQRMCVQHVYRAL